jgi:hypothetical protein
MRGKNKQECGFRKKKIAREKEKYVRRMKKKEIIGRVEHGNSQWP